MTMQDLLTKFNPLNRLALAISPWVPFLITFLLDGSKASEGFLRGEWL